MHYYEYNSSYKIYLYRINGYVCILKHHLTKIIIAYK